jgi:glycerophosphoryl diester phosphodiesterase
MGGYNVWEEASIMRKVLSIAHRGYSMCAPENTLAAFSLALEYKPDLIECDVHRTKDGKIIICHDAAVDRTTDGTGKIADMTLEELRKLDAGSKFSSEFAGEKLPTLEEYLDLLKGRSRPQIELKVEGLEEDVVAMIHERDMVEESMVISFHYSAGLRMHEVDERIAFGALKGVKHEVGDEEAVRLANEAASVNADVFAVYYPDVTPALVSATHAANMLMAAWTIDSEEDIRKWANMGVDVITSNDIALLNKVLSDMGLR